MGRAVLDAQRPLPSLSMVSPLVPIFKGKGRRIGAYLCGVLLGCCWGLGFSARTIAQVIPDNTLGAERSQVIPDTINGLPSERIEGGAVRGHNLFHSFQDFNVPEGGGVYFSNPSRIENILSRVTGSNRSNILGTLGVLGNANLFLINPYGIAFGPNAQLDLRGSFIGTSANSVQFDDFEFSASNPQAPPLLEIDIPIGLHFRNNPGNIINQANGLQADPGQTLALLGGAIHFPGGVINSPGTDVVLASVGDGSTIDLKFVGNHPLEFGFPSVTNGGAITLSDGALILLPSTDKQAGGNITIRTHALQVMDGAELISETKGPQNAGRIAIEATGPVIFDGVSSDGLPSAIFNTVGPDASGNAGGITVQAHSLEIKQGARLTADTNGTGNAGNITIVVPNGSVTLDGIRLNGNPDTDFSAVFSDVSEGANGRAGTISISADALIISNQARISSSTSGSGNAGSIKINANSLSVTNGGLLITSTFAQGNAGEITIDATGGSVIFDDTFDWVDADGELHTLRSGASSNAGSLTGRAGTISIQTNSLNINNGAQLSSYTLGAGNAGDILIEADGPVTIDGVGRNDPNGFVHAITNATGSGADGIDNTQAAGHAGDITIRANAITVRNGAVISSDTFSQANGNAGNILLEVRDGPVIVDGVGPLGNPSAVFSDVNTGANGNAGSMTIRANALSVMNGAQLSTSTFSDGNAGGMQLITNTLEVLNGAELSVRSEGAGTAGNIDILADSAQLDRQASITGNTVSGQGNLNLNITDLILRRASNITTNARGTAPGGNINLTGEFLIAFPTENSNITANAQGGPGGRIEINVDNIFGIAPLTFTELAAQLPPGFPPDPRLLPSSDITAISEAGAALSGQVIFNTSGVNPAQGLVELPQNIVDPNALIAANPCLEGKQSEFVITGRGGIPPSPNAVLDQERVDVDWMHPLPSTSAPVPRSEAPAPAISHSAWEQLPNHPPIQPAQGWISHDRGQVTLVAYHPDPALPQRLPLTPAACPAR